MKALFRFHRGSLAASMATVVEIDSIEHLRKVIAESWEIDEKFIKQVVVDHYAFDERVNWDCFMVKIVVVYLGKVNIWPIGFLNQDLQDESI